MHGLGNDFAVFDTRGQNLRLDGPLARAIADRKTGIGCDQVIAIHRAGHADAEMRIFNADGGEVESCGNAARCVARLLMDEMDAPAIRIATKGGMLECFEAGGSAVSVDMGAPHFDWKDIPLAEATDTNHVMLRIDGQDYDASALSVGNPHCVVFVEDAEAVALEALGPRFETHALFPERVNTEFVQVISPGYLRMRVWERGAGITRACGTGACASAVAAHRRGVGERKVQVVLDGGTLDIEWRASDDHIVMTGPTTFVYRGEIDLAALRGAQ